MYRLYVCVLYNDTFDRESNHIILIKQMVSKQIVAQKTTKNR